MYLEKKPEHFDGFEIFGHNGRVSLTQLQIRKNMSAVHNTHIFFQHMYLFQIIELFVFN